MSKRSRSADQHLILPTVIVKLKSQSLKNMLSQNIFKSQSFHLKIKIGFPTYEKDILIRVKSLWSVCSYILFPSYIFCTFQNFGFVDFVALEKAFQNILAICFNCMWDKPVRRFLISAKRYFHHF